MTSQPVVLITGALTGIGRATAFAFARDKARIVVSGRRVEEGLQLAEELRATGAQAEFVQSDVRFEDEVSKLVDATVARFGRLDIAVNSAGTEGESTPVLAQTPFTLNVSKNGTQGFSRTGMLLVTNSANTAQLIRYTGLGVDAFEGCAAFLPGAGSALPGAAVTQATLEASVDTLLNSISLP